MSKIDEKQIIVALDYSNADDALNMAKQLDSARCRVKVGKELFTRSGPTVVEKLQGLGFEVFLDLKFHDIPNTTAAACRAAAELGVWMVNVHASGGRRMMTAAREAIDKVGSGTLLIGVTVLTSMDQEDLVEIGVDRTPADQVQLLGNLAKDSGLHGLVCSAHEVSELKKNLGEEFVLVTPGVRPAGADQGDQRRVMTPSEALNAGSTHLVIGRPITQAENPANAFEAIVSSISN